MCIMASDFVFLWALIFLCVCMFLCVCFSHAFSLSLIFCFCLFARERDGSLELGGWEDGENLGVVARSNWGSRKQDQSISREHFIFN